MAQNQKATKRTPSPRRSAGKTASPRTARQSSGAREAREALAATLTPLANKHRKVLIACGALLALLLVWGVGTIHFSSHLVPGTTVNGLDASGLTEAELASAAQQAGLLYTNHVTGDGVDLTITSSDISFAVDGNSFAKDAFSQRKGSHWPVDLLRRPTITTSAGISYNEEQLTESLYDSLLPFNESAEQPTNASATRNEEGLFEVEPSQLGTALDVTSVATSVGKSLKVMAPQTTLGEGELKRAEILDDNPELVRVIQEANDICSLSIPLTLEGNTLATVTPQTISPWVSISYDDAGYPYVSIDRNAIQNWSFSNLNAVANGETETRTWEVDSYSLAQQLAPKLAEVDGSSLEIPTITISTRPAESEGHEARGRHIDVNLTTQYARLYDEDGKTVLWRAPIVSGNVSMGHSTPTGEYHINNMERGIVLTGLEDGVELKEGEDPKPEDYYSSYVEYWMCYDGTALGLHDASWRYDEEFGGDTYLWNGSHGCVNLPVDAAAQLFDLVHVGDTVYIHYEDIEYVEDEYVDYEEDVSY